MGRRRNRPGKNERKQIREKKRKEKLLVTPDQSAQPDPPRQATHDGEQADNVRTAEDVKDRKLFVQIEDVKGKQKPRRNINRAHAEEIVRRLKRQNDTIKYINDGQWKTDARLDSMGDRLDDLRHTLTDLNNRCNRAFVIGRTTDDKAEKALAEVAELASRVAAERAQCMEEMRRGNEQLTLELIKIKDELQKLRDLGQREVIGAKKDTDVKQARQARKTGGKVGTEGAWNGRLRGRKA
ncbi:hypothetical protein Cob_v008150 [Colletotrichum orbiculare MAFF 240422]|uniref:Uncharacterized protein n=1 Tax=Colletotrichum orbiculare (strain 104-T / ATCC 96160 / CBS 514.97 / LARS 414 / MAFF 240422) TaxID=1213857 RepID=N4VZ77_COLOR|nr:hypothetical protein Cob_v008150 [Colletotrichum orbiculare MAFF 240422]